MVGQVAEHDVDLVELQRLGVGPQLGLGDGRAAGGQGVVAILEA